MQSYFNTIRDGRKHFKTGAMDGAPAEKVISAWAGKTLSSFSADGLKLKDLIASHKITPETLTHFARRLSAMIAEGIPLTVGLEQLASAENSIFKRTILQIRDETFAGCSFSDAIAMHPGQFNAMFVSIARSGEMAGALDLALDQLATYLENLGGSPKAKATLRYPLVIAGFVLFLVIMIMWKAALPGPALPLTGLLHYYALVFSAIILIGTTGLITGMGGNDRFKRTIFELSLRIPIINNIISKRILAVFSRTMASLSESRRSDPAGDSGQSDLQRTLIESNGSRLSPAPKSSAFKRTKTPGRKILNFNSAVYYHRRHERDDRRPAA